jgi:dipeptidyl aminopeptidase/acylaminoacyl peptidase
MKRLIVASLVAMAALASPAAAQRIDLSTPEGVVAAQRRIWCTERDNEPVYWNWRGEAYSRREGERDRLLFKVEGLNVRTCVRVSDPQRGEGFRSVSRELLIYIDPETNRPLSRWTNPWTNETVDVLHVANDPVNGDFFPRGRDGAPTTWRGTTVGSGWYLTSTIPLFYTNPLGGAYQAEVGGTYHATEMFNFMGELRDLTTRSPRGADVDVGWVRMSDWLPWMRMGGRDGVIYMHTAGRKLLRWEDVSQVLRDEVAQHYPTYRNPPPGDDRRPNVTSWSYYQAVREGRETPPTRE